MSRHLTLFVAVSALALCSASANAADSYTCDKVSDLKVPAKFVPIAGLSAVDLVAANVCDLKKPFLFCHPTSINGGPINDPATQLCCYKAKCATNPPATNFDTVDMFGQLRLSNKKTSTICVPCTASPS